MHLAVKHSDQKRSYFHLLNKDNYKMHLNEIKRNNTDLLSKDITK